jgi:hypothetical protein
MDSRILCFFIRQRAICANGFALYEKAILPTRETHYDQWRSTGVDAYEEIVMTTTPTMGGNLARPVTA